MASSLNKAFKPFVVRSQTSSAPPPLPPPERIEKAELSGYDPKRAWIWDGFLDSGNTSDQRSMKGKQTFLTGINVSIENGTASFAAVRLFSVNIKTGSQINMILFWRADLVAAGSVTYKNINYTFSPPLPIPKINDDDYLQIDFLGNAPSDVDYSIYGFDTNPL